MVVKIQELLEHAGFVEALARKLVFDEHRAADVVQNTWLVALKYPPATGKSPRSWLAKVIRNLAITFHRSETRRHSREQRSFEPKKPLPADEIVARGEARQQLIEAVLSIRDPFRTTLLLRFYENMTTSQIAEHDSVPIGTVKSRLKRGLDQLRERLDTLHDGKRMRWLSVLAPIAGIQLEIPTAGAAVGSATTLSGAIAMSVKMKLIMATVIFLGTGLILWQVYNSLPSVDSNTIESVELTVADLVEATVVEGMNEVDPLLPDDKAGRDILDPIGVTLAFSGTVLNRTEGKPIHEATVTFFPIPLTEEHGDFSVKTDTSGYYHADLNFSSEETYNALHLHITASGYKDLQTRIPWDGISKVGIDRNFYLDENPRYSLLILDPNGNPLPHARAEFYNTWYWENEYYGQDIIIDAKHADSEAHIVFSEQEITRGAFSVYEYIVRVVADPYPDFIDRLDKLPNEIIMEPMGYWNGQIIDLKTFEGIEGVEVSVQPEGINHLPHSWKTSDSYPCATTNATGRFKLGPISLSNKYLGYKLDNIGYGAFRSSLHFEDGNETRFPDRIEIEGRQATSHEDGSGTAPYAMQTFHILNSQTNEPIPNIQLEYEINPNHGYLNHGYADKGKITSDANGFFILPCADREMTDIKFTNKGYLTEYLMINQRNMHQDKAFLVHLKACHKVNISVTTRDELGQSIAGALVILTCWENDDQDRFLSEGVQFQAGAIVCEGRRVSAARRLCTHEDGTVVFNLEVSPSTIGCFTVERTGYVNYKSEYFPFGPTLIKQDKTLEETLVLKRGILYQNILVRDQDGDVPFEDKRQKHGCLVMGELTLADGKMSSIFGDIDSNGIGTLVLQPFTVGYLYIQDKPETKVNFDFEMVMNHENITLVVADEMKEDCVVRGMVKDESGQAVEGMRLKFQEDRQRFGRHPIHTTKTSASGRFSVTVFNDGQYHLDFIETQIGDKWYVNKKQFSVTGSDFLDVTVKSYTGVWLAAYCFYEKEDPLYEYNFETWLVTESGQSQIVDEINKRHGDVLFLGVPDGKYKAIVETKTGIQYHSELFEVKDGKSVKVKLIVP